MFAPLALSDLASASAGARIYCRPICFVDRPHEWGEACLRLSNSLLWFASWQIILRDGGAVKSMVCSVSDWDQCVSAMPGALGDSAMAQRAAILQARPPLVMGDRQLGLHEPRIMGILNVTPDSFSDGGAYDDPQAAIDAGFAMTDQGAAIIDVGGESTRPGAPTIWEGDEVKRIEPVVAGLARGGALISIDTRKALVMEAALAAGASIINDVSALRYDERAMEVAAGSQCPIVLMHAPSAGPDSHSGAPSAQPLLDVFDMLQDRLVRCEAAGIARDRLIIDPGIGFGKGVADNLAIINGLALLHGLGCPILFAASRKRLIGALDGEAAADDRLGGTIALHYHAVAQGAQMIRVHDVRENRQALRMWRGMRDAALSA